jgi:hypothetical protein
LDAINDDHYQKDRASDHLLDRRAHPLQIQAYGKRAKREDAEERSDNASFPSEHASATHYNSSENGQQNDIAQVWGGCV